MTNQDNLNGEINVFTNYSINESISKYNTNNGISNFQSMNDYNNYAPSNSCSHPQTHANSFIPGLFL